MDTKLNIYFLNKRFRKYSFMLPKYVLNKEDTNEHPIMNREESMRPQPYTKNQRQLLGAGAGDGSKGKDKAYQLVV